MTARRSPDGDTSPLLHAPGKVETRKANKRKKRAKRAVDDRIQRTARERQDAWLEGGQPNHTERLTQELVDLYDDHRDEQAGTLTDPYLGRVSAMGLWSERR